MLARLFLRLILIPLGYTAAVFSATLALVLSAYAPFLSGRHGAEEEALAVVGAWTEFGVGAFVIGSVAFLPAAAAILVAEVLSLRSVFYYAVVGAVFAGLAVTLGGDSEPAFYSGPAVLAASLLGALAYWLIAGRSAGLAEAARRGSSAPPTAASPRRLP